MKKIYLFVFVLCLFSCGEREIEIIVNDIFNYKGEYYVLFYLDGCMSCRNSKLKIEEMSRRYDYVYFYVNLLDCEFTIDVQDNVGVSCYEEINVLVAPTLLFIKNGKVYNEFVGYNEILIWAYVI